MELVGRASDSSFLFFGFFRVVNIFHEGFIFRPSEKGKLMAYIKQIFIKAFDIFVRKAVNYGTVTLIALFAITLWLGQNEWVTVGANVVFALMTISVCGYFLQDLAINCQLVAFVGRLATRVESTKKEMDNPSKYKAYFMSEALAKDTNTIKYLDRINITSAYDTLIFGARNFGYILLPIATSFGMDISMLGVTWWPFVFLCKLALVAFLVRYLGVLAVTLAATGLAEKYNDVIDFYRGDAASKEEH